MIRSQVRAQVAANHPEAAKGADGPDDQAAKATTAPPLQGDRPGVAPSPPRQPWLVRNSRKATLALVLAVLAALPFAYRYLQHEFGPDPFVGIKLDRFRIDAITGISEVVKPAEIKPAPAKPAAAAGPIEPEPKPLPPRPSASPASSLAAAAVAPSVGVTHTRPAVAGPVKPEAAPPVAAIPDARGKSAKPRANAREEQTVSGACTEAVAALGFCNPSATVKDK